MAKKSDEEVLKQLENLEKDALLNGDSVTLGELLSPEIVVHNPENTIVNFDQIMERIKAGRIKFSSFERFIENISIVQNIGIVMGKEVVTPDGNTTNAGKIVTSRFTNIWMRSEKSWKLTARQTTVISVQ